MTPRRSFVLCSLAGCLVLAAGCGRGRGTGSGLLLRPLVEAHQYRISRVDRVGETGADLDSGEPGLTFPQPPQLADMEHDHERRPVVLTTPAPWTWRGRVPRGNASFHAGVEVLPELWKAGLSGIEARVTVHDGRRREVVALGRTRGKDYDGPRWLDIEGDLSAYAGREITLELAVDLPGLPAGREKDNVVAWAPVSISAPDARRPHPNILFILVDTLRRDHLTPYGYARDTSPEIASRIAQPGAVVEEAYSQAPWTLPSVVSMMTSRQPGEILGADLAAFGIPDGVEPMAVRLGRLGYETAGFLANPTLHAGAGFERGFATYYAPPADVEWIRRHADGLNGHALPWLRSHQDRPFFVYVHYIDPHDPYDNPDIVNGRSAYLPDYNGPVTGSWVHDIYSGYSPIPDLARDLPQIQALYDSEIHYVDRYIGKLLATLSPEVLANTLIVFTADHGEEHFDHRGWKHGQALYDEQTHVPLFLRWDGHIPAGRRLPGTVRLLDLLPTLNAAAGGTPDPAWAGFDLLPALTAADAKKDRLAERPAFTQHLAGGPLRAAAILNRRKLILYNPLEPYKPNNILEDHLWKNDLGRLQPIELYDLAADPKEKVNLAANPENPAVRRDLDLLAPIIHRRLDFDLPGLRLLTDGAAPGSRLAGSITFAQAPLRWVPYFLGREDRVELSGKVLRFDLRCGAVAKGLRVEGEFGSIESLAASLDGQPLPPARLRIGQDAPYSGGAVAPRALLTREWPGFHPAGGLRLWVHDTTGKVQVRDVSPETAKALHALGYQ